MSTPLADASRCPTCAHPRHPPGACTVLFVYGRGVNDPPGNFRCLCDLSVEDVARLWLVVRACREGLLTLARTRALKDWESTLLEASRDALAAMEAKP